MISPGRCTSSLRVRSEWQRGDEKHKRAAQRHQGTGRDATCLHEKAANPNTFGDEDIDYADMLSAARLLAGEWQPRDWIVGVHANTAGLSDGMRRWNPKTTCASTRCSATACRRAPPSMTPWRLKALVGHIDRIEKARARRRKERQQQEVERLVQSQMLAHQHHQDWQEVLRDAVRLRGQVEQANPRRRLTVVRWAWAEPRGQEMKALQGIAARDTSAVGEAD